MDQRWAHIDLRRQREGLLAEDRSRHLIDDDFPVEAVGWLADNSGVLAGGTIGPFAVYRLIGVGGMGEVYSARDTKLGRNVAIKILPPAFATDPERLARFKREAQILASLNHSNIAAIHGFEDSE